MAQAETIDEVIRELDTIIADARRRGSRLGYFAALYRKVTVAVREGIARGEFDDGPRMAALDVNFANRYLAAFGAHRRGEVETHTWDLAFHACDRWLPVVTQHLLLGMNAHINLDLGIAAAQTCPGPEIEDLHADFNRINGLLASLVDEVKAELAEIWRPLGPLDRLSGNIEDVAVNFSMTKARDAAWALAIELAGQDPSAQAKIIARRDRWATTFGLTCLRPPIGRLALLLIRLGERRSVDETIEILI